MTRSKKAKKNNGMVGVVAPLGPQSVANVLPKQVRFRTFQQEVWQDRCFAAELVGSTQAGTAYGPIGTKFCDIALGFTMSEFFELNDFDQWDAYRVDEVQFYAYLIDADCTVRIMTAIDFDDSNVESWATFRRRNNVSTTVLRLQNPMQLIAKFAPYPNYDPITSGDRHDNLVGKPKQWFDTAARNQAFVGIKVHAEGSSPLASSIDPKVGFLQRIKVTWRAPT